jgi:hypothetical protein
VATATVAPTVVRRAVVVNSRRVRVEFFGWGNGYASRELFVFVSEKYHIRGEEGRVGVVGIVGDSVGRGF